MKNHSEVFLESNLVEDLQNVVAELEHRVDNAIENAVKDNACVDKLLELREGVFQLLILVSNLDEELAKSFRRIIAEYLEQIYAFHAKLEGDLESLEDNATFESDLLI
jgi:hypothetical protein